jgi:hypothetical protein
MMIWRGATPAPTPLTAVMVTVVVTVEVGVPEMRPVLGFRDNPDGKLRLQVKLVG